MKKRTFILLLLLQVFSLAVVAHPVSMTLAREVGAKFINANTTTAVVSPNDLQWVTTYRTSSNDAAFHVFNLPEGWVIVAADNCATPILAYAETGSFDPNNLPPAMEDYLMGFVEQMEYSMVNLLPALDTVAHQWEIVQATGYLKDDRATTAVSPLLTTQWGQGSEGYKYNILCPTDSAGSNGHAKTGCVAVAMAQLMRYWRYPQTGTGSHSYTPSNYPSQTQNVNFGNTTYDWDNMPNALSYSSTEVQNNAVAQLLWHCGVSIDTDYGATSSGASTFDMTYALPQYFKYSSDLHYDNRSGFSDSQWLNKIKADLDNGRPIIYRAPGHCFVCDGYNSSNLLHFNWGWKGKYQNTYFALDALTPGSHNYNDNNSAIFNIHPLASYQVTLSANPTNGGSVSFDSKGDRGEVTYGFDDGSLMGWTSIDADGDSYGWESSAAPYSYYDSTVVLSGGGHNASEAYLVSGSYSSVYGVLTPDNYLVSPSKGRYSQLRFYACAQDINYAADHFGVAVSTTGNTNPSDFTTIQEWTMTAKSRGPQIMTAKTAGTPVPGRGNNRSQGTWYQYVVDLSAYAGQDIWVAIRHFNCTDWFLLDIDDITLVTGNSGGSSISATFNEGQTCSISARPSTGYYFANWTENGMVVSCDATYSFTVTGDRDLVANFAEGEACGIVFDLYDSFDDGWNDNYLVIDYGNGNSEQITVEDGTSASYFRVIATGSHITLTWIMGNWPEECSFTVHYEDGDLIYESSNIGSNFEYSFDVDCSGGNVTQTVELSAGWNWFSANVEITLDDLKAALLAAYPNASANELVIKGYGTGQTAWNPVAQRWIGGLTEMDLSKMYMVKVPAAGEIALEGELVNPADHPCTISNGVNWIAFPLSQSKSVSEAFAGFPANGDVVKGNRSGQATWNSAAHRWIGQLQTLEPGQGYIYQSSVAENRVLLFAHDYVDLGLPSGLLWATCNVGANAPEEYGDYFAWGETTPKDTYNWSTYQYCMGSSSTLTKYCSNSSYGYNGFTDDLTTLLPEDDAATANWGPDWRMPTYEEWQELYNNTTVTWTTQNGVSGRLFTAANGNSLFLPAAGYRNNSGLNSAGSWGNCWSSSLYTDYPDGAWYFGFDSDAYGMGGVYRSYGRSVRPVRSASQN